MANERTKSGRRVSPGIAQPPAKTAPLPKLMLLITIVNREKTEAYLELLHLFDINLQLACTARGTASTEMLRYLGLTDSSRSVIFSVVREDKAGRVLTFLGEQFQKMKNGRGIAFTVPLSSVIGVSVYRFLSNSNAADALPSGGKA